MRNFLTCIAAFLAAVLFSFQASAAYVASGIIANGTALSAAIDLTPYTQSGAPTAVAIIMPAAWTTASITLQGSTDGCTTFHNIFVQGGTEYTVTSPDATEYIILSPADLVGLNCLKIRSGTAGSPVNQGAARTMGIVLSSRG